MDALKEVMAANRNKYADLITNEMGKPRMQALGEINKSIAHINYYVKNFD